MSNLTSLFGGGGTTNQSMPFPGGQPQLATQNALSNYQNLFNQVGGNQGNYVSSQVNPAIQSNAMGYGNLLQSQGQRGIRGSSFGDQALGNYTNAANTNIADITGQALQQSYGLQGNINQGIAGIGNNMMNANLAQTQQNQQNANTNAGLFGGAMGGLGSLLGSSNIANLFGTGAAAGGGVDAAALAQFMALG